MQGQNPNGGMAGAAVGTVIGYPIGAKIEGSLGNVFNPWYRQEWKELGLGVSVFAPKSPIPSWAATMVGGTIQEITGNTTQDAMKKK